MGQQLVIDWKRRQEVACYVTKLMWQGGADKSWSKANDSRLDSLTLELQRDWSCQ